MTERLRIGYLVPGHRLAPSAGPTRNVLSMSGELASLADVTVAFSDGLTGAPPGVRTMEIAPGMAEERSGIVDDAALRGIGYRPFVAYLRSLRRFVDQTADRFDVVLEKGWMFSGYACARYRARGTPAIPVENLVQLKSSSERTDLVKGLKQSIGRHASGRYLRHAGRVIAETKALREAIVDCHGVDPDRIEVVELGVDRDRFRPSDRAEARGELGLDQEMTMLLYVGVLDRIHDLEPVIRGIASAPNVRLDIVGDGSFGDRYRDVAVDARVTDRVRFRGGIPHDEVARWIAASDLCVAPYDPSAFYNDQVPYSTLKTRECLAAGRPVISVRSGSIPDLIRDGETGLLVEHRAEAWRSVLERLPRRDELHVMGERAAAERPRGWDDVAQDYLKICESVVGGGR